MKFTEITFRMIGPNETIPVGLRLANVNDVVQHQIKARHAMTLEWGFAALADGNIAGKGYNYEVEYGSFASLRHKLMINKIGNKHGITFNKLEHLAYYECNISPNKEL